MEDSKSIHISQLASKLPLGSDFEELMKRKFFWTPSFSIYGGVAGLYDFGPPGCAIKQNLLSIWRRHFVLEEGMFEIECTSVTPEIVLTASGHVEKFKDVMMKDLKTGKCFRSDKILEEHMEKLLADPNLGEERRNYLLQVKAEAETYDPAQLGQKMREFEIKSEAGNDFSEPQDFNLMFQTAIGATGDYVAYLRPETAQGIFVNFQALLEANGGKVPFAAAQIGPAFRNEISPRGGLLRVREFTLAEIEHFLKKEDLKNPKFASVADLELLLYPAGNQLTDYNLFRITLGEAVQRGYIKNETLGYFLGRTALFLRQIGINDKYLRFRQHTTKGMAHYARDCWDAEILTSSGWVECVGIADRSCYDLTRHSRFSKARLSVYEAFPQPQVMEVLEAKVNKQLIGKTFKQAQKEIISHLEALEEPAVEDLQCSFSSSSTVTLEVGTAKYELTKDMVTFERKNKKINGKHFLPAVVEPSFGIGRIMQSLLEHAHYVRESDAQRGVLRLAPNVAPYKCSVLPLQTKQEIMDYVPKLVTLLIKENITYKVDTQQSVGRRYARTDEIGVPFALTIDFQTLQDNTVTLRERDSTAQIRIPITEVPKVVGELSTQQKTWPEVQSLYPAPVGKTDEEK